MARRLATAKACANTLGGLAAILWLHFWASAAIAGDNVAGNLINFNNDGMWSWYMDERTIIDPTNGKMLIGSVTSSPVAYPTGRPAGGVDVTTFDFATGSRSRFQLSDIDEDDHNTSGLIILPNGKYLAMYSNHGNTAMGDYLSRYRISTNPHDSSSWSAEQSFNWQTVTGWNVSPNANNRVSYHNLFYLSADNSGAGRIYDFSRGTHQSANALTFNQATNTWSWGGQLTTSSVGGYSTGYIKYASNGTDKIYFMSTETHPRNYNNNMWAGYISDGKTYDMAGNVIDSNLFNNEDTAGVGAVPDISQFTQVRAADTSAVSPGTFRLWSVDLALDNNQNPMGLYIGRHYEIGGPGNGSDTNPIDHRIFYTHWNGTSWQNVELAKMGDRLYRGTDKSEQDYTGLGALVPGDPNTVYISTPYDPRDASGTTTTPWYEIYKGVTTNGGANWTWNPITQNSSVDNLRPIVPAWSADKTALVWFRGTYTTAQNTDAAVVGIVDRKDQKVGLVHYVDANGGNTTLDTGAPISGWTSDATTGNGGSVIAATAAQPALKTTLTGLVDGKYDVFAYFWANQANDWRIQAGFTSTSMQLFRDNGAQQAEASQFDSPGMTLAGGGGFLYRAYIGRVDVVGGSPVSVLVDEFGAASATRAWYDGLGYALVSLTGDYNGDGIVDAADYTVWQDSFGQSVATAGTVADGDGDGTVDQDDFAIWQTNFGHTFSSDGSGGGGLAQSVPEPSSWVLLLMASVAVVRRRASGASSCAPRSFCVSPFGFNKRCGHCRD